MPLNDLKARQKTFTTVGHIRLGQRVPTANGRSRPAKLSTLRFTSPAKHLIEEVQRQYGGEVKPWQGASGPEFEVISGVAEVPVYLARQQIDPWYELWGPGVMQRRCDGVTETKRNKPCLCGPERETRLCKPTTRASVMLADIPGIGVWRVESHGINAATEGLGGHVASFIANLPDGVLAPARLMMVARTEKHLIIKGDTEKIDTYEYMVPVLFVDEVSARQIAGGMSSLMEAINAAEQRKAIGAAPEQPDPEKLTTADVMRLVNFVSTREQVQDLWRTAVRDGAMTKDTETALRAKADSFGKPAKATKQAPAPEPAPQPAPEVPAPAAPAPADTDAVEGDDQEPDQMALWTEIMGAAGARGWSKDDLEQRICTVFEKSSADINGWQMRQFLDSVNRGEIS